MPNNADLQAASLYTSIMQEVKVRALSINTITQAQIGLPSPLAREYCYLQLRMICELIALGCLVAHGDIEATQKSNIKKEYKADQILKRLEELHANFYPIPRKPIFSPGSLHFDNYDGEYLTKADLLSLYGKSGDVLHKGNVRKLLKKQSPIQNTFPDVNNWGQKVLNLLSTHTITRVGGDFHLVTFLSAPQVGGDVMVSVAESPKDDGSMGSFHITK